MDADPYLLLFLRNTVENCCFYVSIDQSSTCTPINICGGVTTTEVSNGEDDTFWSPSMAVPPHSPPFPNTSHEPRSAPPTPNNNRSGTSPPEAAIEATPETTPVKVLYQH